MTEYLFPMVPSFPPSPSADARQCWRTPRRLASALVSRFGLTLDAAADGINTVCRKHWSEEHDSLSFQWPITERIWCNPPFSRAAAFARTGYDHGARGGVNALLVLDRGAVWLEDERARCQWWLFRGRVAYEPPPGVEASSPTFGSTLLLRSPNTMKHPGFVGWLDPVTGEVVG